MVVADYYLVLSYINAVFLKIYDRLDALVSAKADVIKLLILPMGILRSVLRTLKDRCWLSSITFL